MSDVVLVKAEDGKLQGLGLRSGNAYARWIATVQRMEVGETLRFSFRLPRSPKHHRLFFAKLNSLFEMQEQYAEESALLAWLKVGAGHADLGPGPHGHMVAIPKSINWENLEEADFAELHQQVDAFMWTPRARRFLWPHMDDAKTMEMVEAWRLEFDR